MEKNTNVMKLVLKNSYGEAITVSTYPHETIEALRRRIEEEAGISLDFNLVNNNGQKPTNDQKVLDYISSSHRTNISIVKKEDDIAIFPSTCIVPGCGNSKITNADKTYFCLPRSEIRRQKWLSMCKREDLSDVIDIGFVVCSDHFIEEQFTNQPRKRLKEDSIPSVFPVIQEEEDLNNVVPYEETESEYLDGCEMMIKTEPQLEDNSKHPGQLCRLCANSTVDMIYIFSKTGKDLNIANKINISLPVWVQKTDPLPKQLCSACVLKLDMCYEFSQSCVLAEEKLKSMMKLKKFWTRGPEDAVLDMKPKTFFEEEAESLMNGGVNFKHDLNSDIQKDNNLAISEYCCPLCCEGQMKLRENELDICCKVDDDVDVKLPNPDKETTMKHIQEEDRPNLQSNVIYEVKDEEGSNYALIESGIGWWNDENALEGAEIIIETLNPEEANLLCGINDESMSKWDFAPQIELEAMNPLCCQICGETFTYVEECLDHSKLHIEEGCYPCSLCGMLFSSEVDIISHCEEHKVEEKKLQSKTSRGRITCMPCGRRFNSEKTLSEHSCGSSETKQFRCDICKKVYISEKRLAFHHKFHEGARPNFCSQCGKEFDNEGSLYYHTRMVHEGARPFCCEVCGKRFYSNARLKAHKRVHSGERPFECEVCGRRFYDRETLKGHYVTHMSVKPFQCDVCGMCCGRKSLLKQHMHIHHSETYMPKRVPSLIHYFCKICNKTYTSSSDVTNHRTKHWGTILNVDTNKEFKDHMCEYCGQSFPLVTLLGKHRKQEHPDEQPYVCSICKETSRTLYEARVHRKTHTSSEDMDVKDKIKSDPDKEVTQKVFICEECGKPVPGRRKFMAHMKGHRVDLPFECTVCGKKFIENQRLLIHMRLHTGEKPYSCSECGKGFTQSSALYTHTLLHTGEKPHSCELCGKAFRIKADRDNHRRTHTGEKPYRCEFCAKQFRTGQVYYQHRMIHTGERRFPCDVCGKAFKRSYTLVVHKRIHTGEKPNICDICGRGFRQRTDMKKHRALHGTSS